MNIIQEFLCVQKNIRMYHWTTPIYNKHVVSGELYEKLDVLIDKFVETYLGKNKITFNYFELSIKQQNIISLLKKFKQFLMGEIELFLDKKVNSDLKNIRDEILGEINRFIFLLSLE